MTYLSPKLFTFEDFLNQYGDDPRYQLIDGDLRDMEPTGPQESVAGKIAGRLWGEILRLHLPWTIPKNCGSSVCVMQWRGVIRDETLI
jgi:Uma2 family endonuclease